MKIAMPSCVRLFRYTAQGRFLSVTSVVLLGSNDATYTLCETRQTVGAPDVRDVVVITVAFMIGTSTMQSSIDGSAIQKLDKEKRREITFLGRENCTRTNTLNSSRGLYI